MLATLERPRAALTRVRPMAGEGGVSEPLDPALVAVGQQLEAERKRLTLDKDDLARLAKMSRTTLDKVLKGGGASENSIDRVRRALVDFDIETRRRGEGSDVVPLRRHGDDTVTFRLKGNFGVDVTLQGPVGDLDELEKSVTRLIREMRENDER